MLKKTEPKIVKLGEVEYAIYPFSAFYSANLSGTLAKTLGPLLAGVVPIFVASKEDSKGEISIDLTEAMPYLTQALQSLDGDTIESLFRKLLIDQHNIGCQYRGEDGRMVQDYLTQDLADELFIGDISEMYILALNVIQFNFKGFFPNLLNQFGGLDGITASLTSQSTENLTPSNLASLS